MKSLKETDPQIAELIKKETKRQEETLDLIASENYPSRAVKEALSSSFVSKYSEGRPLKRYYGGMAIVDELEPLVEQRVLKALGLEANEWAVNVQPYSGSPANYAVLRGLAEPGDKIMGLSLSHGGHLTHGAAASLSGQDFRPVYYSVSKDGFLDYEEIGKQIKTEKPKIVIAGYTAYPRVIDFKKFKEFCQEANSYLFADISHIAGLVIGGSHPSPFPYADVVMFTTHKSLRGPRGAVIVCRKELKEKIFPKVFPGLQGGPHNHTIAAIGVSLKEAMASPFKSYAKQIVKNAFALAEELKKRGFSLVSGGTDNHLILIDLTNKNISGKECQNLLERCGIVLNRNSIPYDTRSAFDPSGIRIGTPAVTTRGMKEAQMKKIAALIDKAVSSPTSYLEINKEVVALCKRFPLP